MTTRGGHGSSKPLLIGVAGGAAEGFVGRAAETWLADVTPRGVPLVVFCVFTVVVFAALWQASTRFPPDRRLEAFSALTIATLGTGAAVTHFDSLNSPSLALVVGLVLVTVYLCTSWGNLRASAPRKAGGRWWDFRHVLAVVGLGILWLPLALDVDLLSDKGDAPSATDAGRPDGADPSPAEPEPHGPPPMAAEGSTTTTTTSPPTMGCDPQVVERQIRDRVPYPLGDILADHYSRHTNAIGCGEDDFGPHDHGRVKELRFRGGENGRGLIFFNELGELAVLPAQFRAEALAHVADDTVIRVRTWSRDGTRLYIFDRADGSCTALYRHRSDGEVIDLGVALTVAVMRLSLFHSQMPYVLGEAEQPTSVVAAFTADDGRRVEFRLELDDRGVLRPPPRAPWLGTVSTCPESASMAALASAPGG